MTNTITISFLSELRYKCILTMKTQYTKVPVVTSAMFMRVKLSDTQYYYRGTSHVYNITFVTRKSKASHYFE